MIVYVANAGSQDLSVLELDAGTGGLTPTGTVSLSGPPGPMAMSNDRQFLYVVIRSEPWRVNTFATQWPTGALTQVAGARIVGNSCYLSIDRSGQYLLQASLMNDCLSINTLRADGSLELPPVQVIRAVRHPHCILTAPDNRFAFASSLEADQILQYRFDSRAGVLTPNSPPVVHCPPGSGPRHLKFHPNGAFAYLLHETDASLAAYSFDSARGALTEIQRVNILRGPTNDIVWAADLQLTPDGGYAYATERGSSTINGLRIDATTGRLEPVESIATERQPRGIAIDPSGRWLLSVGQLSHHLSSYALSSTTGQLTLAARVAVGHAPHWIEIHDPS